jgi:hypothetical protein
VTTPTPDRLTEALGNNKGPDYAAAARACSILDEAVLSGALTAAERRLVHPYVGPDEFAPSVLADRPEPGELDAAWAEAVEAAGTEGVELATLVLDGWAEAISGDITEQAESPAAALRALAEVLRNGR